MLRVIAIVVLAGCTADPGQECWRWVGDGGCVKTGVVWCGDTYVCSSGFVLRTASETCERVDAGAACK